MFFKSRVKCFNAAYHAGGYAGRADMGYNVVPVAQIVGSVGRCEELDDRFHPRKETEARLQRLDNIRRLVQQGVFLPPVELYRLKDEYYVVDGNHRVAIAKENNQTYIDAHVVEYLPDGQRAEDRIYLERRAFGLETGLDEIRLSQVGGYARLRQEIEQHREALPPPPDGGLALKQAARDWYARIYKPAMQAITAARLPQRLPGSTLGDLYLDVQGRRTYCHACRGQNLSLEQAIARVAAEYPLPTIRQRLARAGQRLGARIAAWWRLQHTDALLCDYAMPGPNGTVYCRRRVTRKT